MGNDREASDAGSVQRPRLLDLFCGAGGAAMGYHQAGFEVVGVDINPQPRYPFEFIQADAVTFPLDGFDVIHASPPCQAFSRLQRTGAYDGGEHEDLVAATRARMQSVYVIENVHGAPLLPGAIMCCGKSFGLRTYRHRWFECSHWIAAPRHRKHVIRCEKEKRRKEYFKNGGFISVVGDVGSYCGPEAMGINWMTGAELSQAIPPAYTRWIGRQLMEMRPWERMSVPATT